MGSNGSNTSSPSVGGFKASTSTSKNKKATTLGTPRSNKVSKGKKVATPEIVDFDYSVIEDMKKTRENISIFELSKISSYQELVMKAWKDDKEYSVEEKGKAIVNLVMLSQNSCCFEYCHYWETIKTHNSSFLVIF